MVGRLESGGPVASSRPLQNRDQLGIHFGERLNVSGGEAWPAAYARGSSVTKSDRSPFCTHALNM